MIETLITASPELFREMSREEMMDFMKRAYTFVAERVREDNIVSAVIHLDEKTPHMHLCFVPLTKDHRLCAKEILGNRTHLSKYWQDGFFEYMHEQYSQLERGEPAAETKRKHIPVWLYKKGEHLDRMYGQVKEILDNIGILNAKGKSKEALELLRQWSKEGEYFSSKIKEVTGHIDGLNAEVNKWQSKYNSERRMVYTVLQQRENLSQTKRNEPSSIPSSFTSNLILKFCLNFWVHFNPVLIIGHTVKHCIQFVVKRKSIKT